MQVSSNESYFSPGLSDSIKAATRIKIVHSVESANNIDARAKNCSAMVRAGACRVHLLYLEVRVPIV